MSSEISAGKTENPNGEQPSNSSLESSINERNEIPNPESAINDPANSRNEEKLDLAMQVASGDEEALAEKVEKLELTLNETGEKAESNNNTGIVVQNQLSESLSFLQEYGSDQEDDSGQDFSPQTDDDVAMKDLQYRDFSSGCEDSDEDTDSEDYDSMDDISIAECTPANVTEPDVRKEAGKIDLSWMAELASNEPAPTIPDISSLELNNREEFKYMGDVECTIDRFVTIVALPGIPAYDLDTLLFLEEGSKVLGYISDVMGPVTAPIYVIYMDAIETVQSMGLQKGKKVYCAPKSKYTKYVFLQELMKIRGSDASWVGDAEVPPEFEEFSDDEEERRRRKESVENEPTKRKRASLERHRRFESSMNKINKMNTRLHNMMDERNPLRQRICDVKKSNKSTATATSNVPEFLTKPPPPLPQNAAFLPANQEVFFANSSNWSHSHVYNQDYFMPPPQMPIPCTPFMTAFDPSTPPPNYGGSAMYFPPVAPSMSNFGNAPCTNLDAQNLGAFGPICRPNNRPGPSFGN